MNVTEVATTTLTRRFYDAFQRAEVDRGDGLVASDVLINSSAAYGLRGLDTLKN
jgi:hypothetical protein